MGQPVVSVIVPVYNVEKYLPKCLDSLVGQTLREIEIICVNDGSTDHSQKILEVCADHDKRVKLLSQKNQGQGVARDVALSAATGKYLMFCDADDWFEPSMCEEMAAAMEQSGADLAECKSNAVMENDATTFTARARWHEKARNQSLSAGMVELTPQIKNIKRVNMVQWNRIFRKDLVNQYNIRNVCTYYAEDVAWTAQYLLVAKTVFGLDRHLHNYLIRAGSTCEEIPNNRRYLLETVDAFRAAFELARSHNFEASHIPEFLAPFAAWRIYEARKLKRRDALTVLEYAQEKLAPLTVNSLVEEKSPWLAMVLRGEIKAAYDQAQHCQRREFLGITVHRSQKQWVNRVEKNKKWLFGVEYYKKLASAETVRKYWLGVPVYVSKKSNGVTRRYLLGARVCKKTGGTCSVEDLMKEARKFSLHHKLQIEAAALHPKTFGEFKNSLAGRDVVLVGAGPTMRDYRQIPGAVHVGCNRAFMLDHLKLDFLFAQDVRGINSFVEEFINYQGNRCVKFIGDALEKEHQIPESWFLRTDNARKYKTAYWPPSADFYHALPLHIDTLPLLNSCTVAHPAMQFILFTNPRRIFLVGCDCTVMAQGHFIKGGKDDENLQTDMSSDADMLRNWGFMKDFATLFYPETKIISVNPVGLQGMFIDWNQKEGEPCPSP
ncbi:MAG: glycosyltransferase [Verrucomicrobiales bacterium]|jgi:glycosyltransferase involved in cell wall biosynthesis|nr:glycosyltransferase [Verrucomicrobiales bacterium]